MRHASVRARAWLVAAALGLGVALLAPATGIPGGPLGAQRALAADTDLTLVTAAAYDVRPDTRVVHVTVAIVATNHRAETTTTRYYFDRAFLAVLPGTANFKVSGAKGAKVTVTKAADTYTMLRLDFGSRLYSGASRTYTLEFDIVESTAATRQVRVGASLASFPVWAFASNGATGSTVSVTFPAGYDVTVQLGSFAHTEATPDGGTRLLTDAISTPLTWFAYVVGQRPPTFAETALDVRTGTRSVALTLRAWSDDTAWATRVGDLFTRGLPQLATDIGLPWPDTAPTVVQEAVSQTTGGYAGLYDPTESRIEVAYWADRLVVLHEAAHGWFNGNLLTDRWADEGFASLYAERAAAALKEAGASPELTDEIKAARIPLNDWGLQTASQDRPAETYGYAASLELARLIAARAGDDALRQVWTDAAGRLGAYQPPALSGPSGSSRTFPAETVSAAPDWRGLLDLLVERTGQDFSDLWRTWVVTPDQAAALDARAAARISYQRTLSLANGWALPRSIRDALRGWQFDSADQLMADARTVLMQRTAVEARAARNGLTLPGTIQRLFEAGSFAAASAEAQSELNAMLTLEGAVGARPEQPDVLQQIGMFGADPEADVAAARASLAAGNLDATLTSSTAAFNAWNNAWQEGRRRALLAVAVLATVLVLSSAVAGGLRRARRSRAAAHAHPASRGGDLPGPPPA